MMNTQEGLHPEVNSWQRWKVRSMWSDSKDVEVHPHFLANQVMGPAIPR